MFTKTLYSRKINMNRLIVSFTVVVSAVALSMSAFAHDPSEHMKDGEKPDCGAMEDMDHSKMDMNDPVMQAMMEKCMKQMHHGDEAGEGDEHTQHHQAGGNTGNDSSENQAHGDQSQG